MCDPDKRFEKPIGVRLDNRGVHVITSARDAADTLLFKWPDAKVGLRYILARKACLPALGGLTCTGCAQRAFEAAAHEAGILAEI